MATNALACARALAPGGRFAYGVWVCSRDADGESRVLGSSKAAPIAAMSASISSMCSRLTVSQFEATNRKKLGSGWPPTSIAWKPTRARPPPWDRPRLVLRWVLRPRSLLLGASKGDGLPMQRPSTSSWRGTVLLGTWMSHRLPWDKVAPDVAAIADIVADPSAYRTGQVVRGLALLLPPQLLLGVLEVAVKAREG